MKRRVELAQEPLRLLVRLLRLQTASKEALGSLLFPLHCLCLQVNIDHLKLHEVPRCVAALRGQGFGNIRIQLLSLHEG